METEPRNRTKVPRFDVEWEVLLHLEETFFAFEKFI